MMNIAFRMFDDSNAAKGIKKAEHLELSSEQVAMAALLKGVHYSQTSTLTHSSEALCNELLSRPF
jgi:hypothetical protein